MERRSQSLVYLDTHIVVWLYAGLLDKFTPKAKTGIDDNNVVISQFVRLELQYLYETMRDQSLLLITADKKIRDKFNQALW